MRRTYLKLIASMLVGIVTVATYAQTANKPSAAQIQTAPGEQHKVLAAFVGDFDLVAKIQVGPKAPPLTAHAVSHGEWIMGNRFVEVKSAATADEPLKGERLLIYGYDPAISKYTLLNLDSGSLVSTLATGNFDPTTQIFTFNGEKSSSSGNPIRFEWLLKIKPEGVIEQTILVGGSSGKLTEAVSVIHTPKKP